MPLVTLSPDASNIVSSAYILQFSTDIVKSLIKRRNKAGPRTEPCGTPELSDIIVDVQLLYFTLCFLSLK